MLYTAIKQYNATEAFMFFTSFTSFLSFFCLVLDFGTTGAPLTWTAVNPRNQAEATSAHSGEEDAAVDTEERKVESARNKKCEIGKEHLHVTAKKIPFQFPVLANVFREILRQFDKNINLTMNTDLTYINSKHKIPSLAILCLFKIGLLCKFNFKSVQAYLSSIKMYNNILLFKSLNISPSIMFQDVGIIMHLIRKGKRDSDIFYYCETYEGFLLDPLLLNSRVSNILTVWGNSSKKMALPTFAKCFLRQNYSFTKSHFASYIDFLLSTRAFMKLISALHSSQSPDHDKLQIQIEKNTFVGFSAEKEARHVWKKCTYIIPLQDIIRTTVMSTSAEFAKLLYAHCQECIDDDMFHMIHKKNTSGNGMVLGYDDMVKYITNFVLV